jgi:hypothetical protein
VEQAAASERGGSEEIFRDTYHNTRLLLIERRDGGRERVREGG